MQNLTSLSSCAIAIIADNFGKGRKKHIWFSASTSLKAAAQADLYDIGCKYVSLPFSFRGAISATSLDTHISI